jgi:hypothetical protein
LASEKNLVEKKMDADDIFHGRIIADVDATRKCAHQLKQAIFGASEQAQDEAKKMIPEAEELCEKLEEAALMRIKKLEELDEVVQSRAATTRDVFEALISCREGSIPGQLLQDGYAKLRRKKLEFIPASCKTALGAGQVTLGVGLWLRGVALGVGEERNGQLWKTSSLEELGGENAKRVLRTRGEFTPERSGGVFGTQDWRQNPCYIVKTPQNPDSEGGGQPIRVSVAVAEAADSPSTLAVHVVRNSEEAAAAGCGTVLAPGFEVLASSNEDDELPDCVFDMPEDMDEETWPVFIVVSAAKREYGPFWILSDSSSPVEIEEVPPPQDFWKFEQTLEIEWANKRPFAISMGGGRMHHAKIAPPLSWYRNPQIRVKRAGLAEKEEERKGMANAMLAIGDVGQKTNTDGAPPTISVTSPGSAQRRPSSIRRASTLGGSAGSGKRASVLKKRSSQTLQKLPSKGDIEAETGFLREIFDEVDRSHDGHVSKIELIKTCRKKPGVADFFGLPQHIRQEDGSRDAMEDLFQSMDANNDKDITFEEFHDFYTVFQETSFEDGPTGALLLAILLPDEPNESSAAAIHIVVNNEDAPDTNGDNENTICENPAHHEVVGSSGKRGAEYSTAAEIGAVCEMTNDIEEEILIIPSLQTRVMEGKYKLIIKSTEAITVDRVA